MPEPAAAPASAAAPTPAPAWLPCRPRPCGPAPHAGLVLTPGQPSALAARPGEILTLSFRVRNLTPAKLAVERRLELGTGLRQFGPQLAFEVEPGETATLLAHVQAPRDARAGSHRIRLLLRTRRDTTRTAEWDASVALGGELGEPFSLVEGVGPPGLTPSSPRGVVPAG